MAIRKTSIYTQYSTPEMNLIAAGLVDRGLENVELIFDWCKMEWEYDGKYGVWDDDFRYDVYSMSIPRMGLAEVSWVGVPKMYSYTKLSRIVLLIEHSQEKWISWAELYWVKICFFFISLLQAKTISINFFYFLKPEEKKFWAQKKQKIVEF